ncbi:hypothetical protein FNV62_38440 [Streptomyces sp. RLB3-17]|jgi:hypothetical protein|uniref:SMI1-KNR4 cell-wall n=1 Tax=Streptomyces mirabilis TaxID=68239 RepID=A0ABU3UJT5_9ACTN|nr:MULTISPECIES: hypothetical protein [Streptomyces]MCX4612491.1 hypothetical protein [Streptomyces mirabilis]MCX5352714.1 hypothetical protein [Streptomyces mirabilis]MDU8993804.1 hypothetical protein [Streptomyces mirabilis]NMI61673.1 hypothetical protein [Streptomyces sp. RLA2-12]QDN60751.1 hypothetical protein FNV67_40510 [Streptomyces sp. S1D4-20]
MRTNEVLDTLIPILGPPVRHGEADLVAQIGQEWGVRFPSDFIEVAGAYGHTMIGEFIFLAGASSIRSYAEQMGTHMDENTTVPCAVLPTPGGSLLWGNTIEGDQLFLQPQDDGRWTVSAFRRNHRDWLGTTHEFGEWFIGVLSGELETDWMPEWPPLPLDIEM